MKNPFRLPALLLCVLCSQFLIAQTSWKGITSSAWSTASNWSAGVPTSSTDAIVGDASFTGAFQPAVSSAASCKSLVIGGIIASVLTINKTISIAGNITINSNGTITQNKTSLSLRGNWTNGGTYTTSSNSSSVIFNGATQTLNGSSITTFRKLTVNAGSTVTLGTNCSISGSGSSLTINGTLDPGVSPGNQITSANLTLNSNAILKVNAATFTANYSISGAVTLTAGSTVEYSAATISQTISNAYTYSTLKISGSATKTLSGSLPALNSSSSSNGNIYVTSGTFDLSGFSAARGITTAGGTLSVSNNALVKIGGTGSFPANYATNSLSLASTIEYNGGAQIVSPQTYGNLTLSGASGAVVKTMSATDFTVAGDFTASTGGATSLTTTAASNLNITGNVSLGINTTLNASSFAHKITGNWTNAGTLNGNTSTFTLNGSASTIGGTGAYNFHNLSITASNNAAHSDMVVSGNLSTTGSGSLSFASGKTVTMSGAGKTISGSGLSVDNLSVTGSIATSTSFIVTGNVIISGSFTASGGTVTMSGAGKTIIASGATTWSGLTVTGSVATTSGFSVAGSLNVSGSFTASSSGTITFIGSSSVNGTANLYNVAINGSSLQLSSNAVLGIAGTFSIISGILDVSTSVPNTVIYNGTAAQSVIGGTYHHVTFSNSGVKTAASVIATNGDVTIAAGSNFTSGSYTHTVQGNWVNGGSFTSGTGTISFNGGSDATINGATTFNTLTVNKTSVASQVSLLSNINVALINMTNGLVKTGSNIVTITTNRTGNGSIIGIIKRLHSFTAGTNYAFESPENTITFSAVTGVTSIIVKATKGAVSDFPFGAAINREYDITVPAGSYTATLRLHYEDAQINGSAEHGLTMWRYNGATWLNLNKSANDATANYVELTGLTDITNRWTLSDNASVVRWTGAVSTDWLNAGNWASVQGTPSLPPSSSDIVQIGFTSFTNQPSIASSATAKSISFGSTQAVSLTIQNSGSLFVSGNINGTWSANATHTITNSGSLTANGNLDLSDGTTGHQVNFTSNLGTTIVRGSITQSGNADVALLGVTSFSIGDDYNYTSGSFSAGLGTVNYNGTVVQTVAPLSYYNLTVNKASGNAEINAATSIANTLTIGSGTLDVFANTTVVADVTIAPGASLVAESNSISVGGNWNNSGSFNPGTGTISFNGTGGQTISSSTFNQLIINKPSGTAVLSGNLAINSNLTIGAGVLNLSAYTVNRTTRGGSFIMGDATSLLAGGASNFPVNFSVYSLHGNSTVEYNSLVSQAVEGVSYGHVVFSNGGSNTKTLSASAVISGNITINSGASLASGINTINLYGNWVNNGSFDPGTGAILFSGTAKTITGNSSFYRVSVYGSYTVSGSDITFLNNFRILSGGSYDAGTGSASVQGDLTNSGSLTSNGTTTFAGTQLQTIRLLNAITSNSSGVINFNGTVSPVLNSTSTPTFATLNINNTGGISPSVNWSVFVAFTVNNGAVFNGGAVTHNFYGSFTNNGTITSSGVLNIAPVSPQTIKLAGTGFSSTGVVQFGGSSALSVTGTTAILTDVTINNTTGVSPATGWTINRNFSIGSAGIFNAGSNTYTVGGDVQSNGTLNGETSTFTLTSANGQISGSPATTFYHLIVSGALITANSDFNIDGNLATNGTLDVSLGQVHFTGSADAAITGSTSALAQFSIEKSTGSTVSLAKSITAVAAMDILSGIFDEGAYTITQDAGGGKLTLANTAFLKIGGINTLPVFTTYAIDTFSTVDYNGATQTISNASPYGNLTLSSAGTKTAAAALVILNNFSLVNAGFVAGSYTHTAGGNWTMISGSFTNTGNTIVFNGTANQSISSTGAFNNITVNKTSGLITLSSPVNVNGVLSLTSGKISLGNHSLTMGSTASITNASTANYIIAEGTGTLTQPVVAGGTKIFPVGRTIAYLPATLTLTAGSTTDNFSLRVLNGAYTDGSTGIAVTTNAVNTSWVITEAVAGGTNATVLLQWPLSLELPGFTRSFSRLARYTGTAWDYGTGDIAAAGVNPYTVSRSNFTATGVFAVSSYDGVLPVTWLSINGINEGKNNHLYWSTSSNQNNRYFSIEASNDGRNFAAVGRVKTAVGSATTQSYNFIEQDVTQTIRYYRIKQVDHDESFSYSRTVAIKSGAIQSMAMQSTFKGNGLQVYITSNKNTEASLVLYDGAGKMLYLKRIRITRGFNDFMVQPGHLSAGIYFVYLQANDGTIQIFKLTK